MELHIKASMKIAIGVGKNNYVILKNIARGNKMKIFGLLVILILIPNAYSGMVNKLIMKFSSTVGKSTKKVISNKEIVKLSKMSDTYKGTKAVKNYIGKMNLSQSAREYLYLKIAIYQNKISKKEVETMFNNLKGVDGFSSTLSKIIGNNPQGTVGHLNELKIANEGAKFGFKVIGIGKKFDDGIKNSLTDIDVLLRKNGTDILIEAKKYSAKTQMPLDKFKKDLETLVVYGNSVSTGKSIKVFSFTEKPQNLKLLRLYQFWADKKGVQLIFGTPKEQIIQIKMLESIL